MVWPLKRTASNITAIGLLGAIVLIAHAVALVLGAARNSPTWDETAHLPAGLSNWQYGNFDLFRVNPPLVRMTAALPVTLARPPIGWMPNASSSMARQEYSAGSSFFKINGSRGLSYMTIARWACLPFSLLGAIICWLWATQLYGRPAGLIALLLWCVCPNIIGHGQLITPDVAAAALGVTAAYVFWLWLRQPTWRGALVAGIVLGLMELTKTSWVLLFVVWPAVWMLWSASLDKVVPARQWVLSGQQLGAILLVGLYTINLGYGFEGSFTKLGSYRFVSHALAGVASAEGSVGNRFADSYLGQIPVPLPTNYLRGIDEQKRNFEEPDLSYLRGQWRSVGWYYYYLYAMLIKMPVGSLLLLLLAVISSVLPCTWTQARATRAMEACPGRQVAATWTDELVLLMPAAMILLLVSSQTGFNRHLRYVLPAFPFLFIWSSRVTRLADFNWRSRSQTAKCHSSLLSRALALMIVVILTWATASSLWIYPHSLSYFNEFVGGPSNGHWHLSSSNVDWGQDLYFAKLWYDRHPEARPFHFAFRMPLVDPILIGIQYDAVPESQSMNRMGRPKTRLWPWGEVESSPGQESASNSLPNEPSLVGPRPGWYAISVVTLHDRHGGYEYFTDLNPVARIGYTTNVYYITLADANRLRRQLGLPELDDES